MTCLNILSNLANSLQKLNITEDTGRCTNIAQGQFILASHYLVCLFTNDYEPPETVGEKNRTYINISFKYKYIIHVRKIS